jgi:spermidine synthase
MMFLLPVAALLVLFHLVRRHPTSSRAVLMAAAALVGMVLESVILLYYQITSGVLYQNVGLLLMGFMAGMAVGSLTVSRQAAATEENLRLRRMIGYGLLGGLVLICGVLVGLLGLALAPGLAVMLLLLFAIGFVVAGVFAFASWGCAVESQQRLVSPLYAADLLGGFLGALLGGLILIPFLGLTTSSTLMLVLALAILLLSAAYGTVRRA